MVFLLTIFFSNFIKVAAVLLDNGAQIDATTKKGFTPLHLTAKYGNIKVAQFKFNLNSAKQNKTSKSTSSRSLNLNPTENIELKR